ncbi:MAG: peroxiredoxin [Proteobacteria bacterium]|nr:MAG: peroxiredoxin [Pseudomonadota bacterium]
MPTRKARAIWEGSLQKGTGKIRLDSGACEAPYSFGSRFEAGQGTNPEELLAAAHAGCFAMALSLALGKAGFSPERIDAEAHVSIEPADGGFAIRSSRLTCEARVPGIDEATFARHAEETKLGCPVSKALASIEITLEARLTR